MSAEKLSDTRNNQYCPRSTAETSGLIGKKAVFGLAMGASLVAGIGMGMPSIAEASPVAHHIVYQNADPVHQSIQNGNEVIIIGGTGDPGSFKMPGYEAKLPSGVNPGDPTRIPYLANMFPYDASVKDGVIKVRNAIESAPRGTRFYVDGESQGAQVAVEGATEAVHDQPDRGANVTLDVYGAPLQPGGIFDYARAHPELKLALSLVGLAGATVPPPFSPIPGATERFHCTEGARNDSVCHAEGDLIKIAADYTANHGLDFPVAF